MRTAYHRSSINYSLVINNKGGLGLPLLLASKFVNSLSGFLAVFTVVKDFVTVVLTM